MAGRLAARGGDGDPVFITVMCLILAVSVVQVIWPQFIPRRNKGFKLWKRHPPAVVAPENYALLLRITGVVQSVVVMVWLVIAIRSWGSSADVRGGALGIVVRQAVRVG
jgi:hypothetical protein